MSNRMFQRFHDNLLVEFEDDSYFWGSYYWEDKLRIFWFHNNYIYAFGDSEAIPSEQLCFHIKINTPYYK